MNRLVADRYRLLSPLGTGGMGTVWRARDELLHREVAVKELVLPAGLPEGEKEQLRERTRREARAAAKLDSPHAVTVYDVVEQDGHPFLVMELVPAQTLAQVVKAAGPLSPHRVAEIGLSLLSALELAHARGIVHRDVKPSNVLVRPDGRVVLSDFGIAHSSGDASLTSTGLLLGSPSYISPERARGLTSGSSSDLWSLGATLFAAVEGQPPYDSGDALTTITAIVAGDPAPFVLAGPLTPVLAGLLDKDPATRLDAKAARRGLQEVLGTGPSTTAAMPLPIQPRRRRTRLVVAAVVLAVIAIAGSVGFILSTRSPDATAGTATGSPPRKAVATVPASWKTYTSDGWSIRYPAGWEQGTYRGQTQLRDPGTHRTVRVGPATLGASPLAALSTTAASFATSYPSYSQLRLAQRGSGAVWEMTYSDGGADLHAADYAVVLGGRGFTAFTQAKAADWESAQGDMMGVVRSLHTP